MREVVVVGCGVIGLTTALRLLGAGIRVTVLTAEPIAATTSAVAAAVWYPTLTESQERAAGWAAETYRELTAQALAGVPGMSLLPTRMLERAAEEAYGDEEWGTAPLPWWGEGVSDLRRLRRDEVAPPHSGGWSFTAPCAVMPVYLSWLLDRVLTLGGTVRHHRLAALTEAAEFAPIVVNATGLGARRLCGDEALYPVRGDLVLVRNPGLTDSVREQGNPDGYTYVHPRGTDAVLGGTFVADVWDTSPDLAVSRAILRRCTGLVPELADAEVLGHLVGLRPARHGGVRLEVDRQTLGGALLVHNYGHGGAGVTLSWGCADAVAALLGVPPSARGQAVFSRGERADP